MVHSNQNSKLLRAYARTLSNYFADSIHRQITNPNNFGCMNVYTYFAQIATPENNYNPVFSNIIIITKENNYNIQLQYISDDRHKKLQALKAEVDYRWLHVCKYHSNKTLK